MGVLTIVSGCLRGRRVRTPDRPVTRPLLSRVRKSLADILRPRLDGARVLDLFGGSGAIAFELVSNGAASAVIVELNRQAADMIADNARQLQVAAQVEVVPGDAAEVARQLAAAQRCFDIVVVAPPYHCGVQQALVPLVAELQLLADNGIVVVQRDADESQVAEPGGLHLASIRRYGRTVFDFYAGDVV